MFNSESEFGDCFMRSVNPSLWSRSHNRITVLSAHESDCSDGRADWIWASSSDRWPNSWTERTAEALQNPTSSRILAYLKLSSPRSERFLRGKLGVTESTFDRSIRELIKLGLIESTNDRCFLLSPNAELPDLEICAFEFKLENWQRAFYQATRYRSFAHRVFVVLPESTADRAQSHLDAFRLQNVGLISYSSENGAHRVQTSNKRKPRSRSSFIQAIGMLHQSR
jgi:DNA-binding transcriptional ArsR family regulator